MLELALTSTREPWLNVREYCRQVCSLKSAKVGVFIPRKLADATSEGFSPQLPPKAGLPGHLRLSSLYFMNIRKPAILPVEFKPAYYGEGTVPSTGGAKTSPQSENDCGGEERA